LFLDFKISPQGGRRYDQSPKYDKTLPKLSPLQIVRRLKQESTYYIWKKWPQLQKLFWKEKTFWGDGYFCCSIGNASIDTVRKYIESQG